MLNIFRNLGGLAIFVETLQCDIADLVIIIISMDHVRLKRLAIGQMNQGRLAIPKDQDLVLRRRND